jgi:hypothetical protein
MSNRDVIETISTTLSTSIATALGVSQVGVRALQEAEKAGPLLNLWLYQVLPNPSRIGFEPAWKKKDAGAAPPLALSLRYLLTTKVDTFDGHKHLGRAMLHLHEHPAIRLDDDEIVHVTLLPLALDELEKIWAGVQSPRRLSVAYNVDVVVLESQQPAPSPLPVLERNILVMPALAPSIDRLVITSTPGDKLDEWLAKAQRGRMAAALGDTLRLETSVKATKAIIRSALHKSEIEIRPTDGGTFPLDGGSVRVVLDPVSAVASPDGGAPRFIAGPNTICLELVKPPGDRPASRTNELPFMLAPTTTFPKEVTPGEELSLTSDPPPTPEQSVALVLGGVVVRGRVEKEGMVFTIPPLDARTEPYPIRLRIDGADSLLTLFPKDPKQPLRALEPFVSVVKGKPAEAKPEPPVAGESGGIS